MQIIKIIIKIYTVIRKKLSSIYCVYEDIIRYSNMRVAYDNHNALSVVN